jgi:5-methylcytosine-specific restriction endonuclease McrA
MKREFVLEIEKYLSHLVNNVCHPYDGSWNSALLGPQPYNEAVGIPVVLSLHGKIPKSQAASYKEEFFMLDFDDFLEYATSNLPASFSIDSVPPNHSYYYQALPGSLDKPLFANRYGKFSIMGACLSRYKNNLWIIAHFKAETEEYLKKASKIIDLVNGSNFFHYFVTLHLMDSRREAFSSEEEFAKWSGAIGPDRIQEWTEITQNLPSVDYSIEMTRSRITPPFETDYEGEYITDYGLIHTGQLWTDQAEELASCELEENAPADMMESHQLWLEKKQSLKEWQDYFETAMADQFEVTRLMRFLPDYFQFMYDLVIMEKKEVGPEIVRIPRKKNEKRTKVVERPVYKIIKSIRVSYLAEEETRRKLKVPQREWTAPAYRFPVLGHWRQLSQLSWLGHDQDGKILLGKTWVKEHKKGPENEPQEFGTRTPKVVIKLKQTLSYARDVIKSHELDHQQTIPQQPKAPDSASKPTKEWMYEERIKLTAGLRWIIFKRDNYKCAICGKGAEDGAKLEVDHIVPVEKWGKTEESNLRALCKICNRGKGASI